MAIPKQFLKKSNGGGGGGSKVDPQDMKDCMSKQKGVPPFIARAKCLKQLGGKTNGNKK
jgi:hypothetical protein